jgi:hypothetical protein
MLQLYLLLQHRQILVFLHLFSIPVEALVQTVHHTFSSIVFAATGTLQHSSDHVGSVLQRDSVIHRSNLDAQGLT